MRLRVCMCLWLSHALPSLEGTCDHLVSPGRQGFGCSSCALPPIMGCRVPPGRPQSRSKGGAHLAAGHLRERLEALEVVLPAELHHLHGHCQAAAAEALHQLQLCSAHNEAGGSPPLLSHKICVLGAMKPGQDNPLRHRHHLTGALPWRCFRETLCLRLAAAGTT